MVLMTNPLPNPEPGESMGSPQFSASHHGKPRWARQPGPTSNQLHLHQALETIPPRIFRGIFFLGKKFWSDFQTKDTSGGGLFEPLWRNMKKSTWVHLPQFSGWTFQKYLSCHHLEGDFNELVVEPIVASYFSVVETFEPWVFYRAPSGKDSTAISSGAKMLSSWWLNQSIWKNVLVIIDHFPRDRAAHKKIFELPVNFSQN